MKAGSFNLRVQRNERALSFYDSDKVDPEELLETVPEPGWGVVSIQTDAVRSEGFEVEREVDAADPRFGEFHVSALPPAYDADGQIPLPLRTNLAAAAQVRIQPAPA